MSTNRKDTLRELLNPSKAGPPTSHGSDPPNEIPHTERIGSGAVRVMGLSLQRLSADAETGRTLRAQLNSGSNVVEVDPDFIEPSFVTDRFAQADDQAFRDLVKSIETHGQQVPILVRPHPEKSDRYQIAYGHRRLLAAGLIAYEAPLYQVLSLEPTSTSEPPVARTGQTLPISAILRQMLETGEAQPPSP
jgi:ParB family transcriptional regulator, chromosome partitioning protein